MNLLFYTMLLLVVILIAIRYSFTPEFFENPGDSKLLSASLATSTDTDANSEVSEANMNYASLLLFIKKHPDKSAKFITDIKNKFFEDSCSVKTIHFDTITDLHGNTFS